MSWHPTFLLPLLAGLAVFSLGAFTEQKPPPTMPVPSYPLRPDPAAGAALDQALAALAPERVAWLRTDLWHQATAAPLTFEATGVYLTGPDHRLRLDLEVRTDGKTSHLQVVSDGRTLWQREQLAGSAPKLSRADLGQLFATMDRAADSVQLRAEFCRTKYLAGLRPLLEGLRSVMVFPSLGRVRWHGREVLLLTGVSTLPPEVRLPEGFPRQCRLYLDAQSYWPHRLEWWGPLPPAKGDSLLWQMEFRNPVLNQRPADAVFQVPPGGTRVADQAVNLTLRARAK